MPSFGTQVTHQLGQQEAATRLEGLLDNALKRYESQLKDLETARQDDTLTFSFKAMGFKIAGKVVVEDDTVRLDGKLPLAAALFRGAIENSIHAELEKALT